MVEAAKPAAIGHNIADPQPTLRRTDWRFLVPTPPGGAFQHLVLLGGPPSLVEQIVAAGIARQVSCQLPGTPTADALIMLDGAQAALGTAAACLRPGGVFYGEVARRSPLARATSRHMNHELRKVGLAPYLLRGLACCGSSLLPRFIPCCAVTAIVGSHPAAPPSILGHPALPNELRRSDLRAIVMTGGDDFNRVDIFPFALDTPRPIAVLKLTRLPSRNIHTEHERGALSQIRSHLDVAMRRTIPQPLGMFPWGELTVGIESCAPGCSLWAAPRHWEIAPQVKIDDLQRVAERIAEFHQAQISRSGWGLLEIRQWVEPPLTRYKHAFGTTSAEDRLFAEIMQRAHELIGTGLPIVWAHWGFEARNIFRAGGDITVIDWEGGSAGLPLCDLLYFVTYWSYVVQRRDRPADQLHGFRQLFCDLDPRNAISAAAYQAIDRYLTRLDLAPEFFPMLLALMWLERALGRFKRQQEHDPEQARAGNRYVSVLAEHGALLFAKTCEGRS